MFGFFQNHAIKKSTIRKWQKEHEKLARVVTQIHEAYARKDHTAIRKKLKELSILATEHLIDEDKAFYEFRKHADSDNEKQQKAVALIKEFHESFHGTKKALVDFLLKHMTEDDSMEYDEAFKKEMDVITEALTARIRTEETRFYPLISG